MIYKKVINSINFIAFAAILALCPVVTIAESSQPATTSEPSTSTAAPAEQTVQAPTNVQEQPPAQPAPTVQGPQTPTGADAKKYLLNPETGLYESDHYTWDPITKKTSPKQPLKYSYNPATGMWDSTTWAYDAPTGSYIPNIQSTPAANLPVQAAISSTDTVQELSDDAPVDASNTIENNSNSAGTFDLFYNVSISNAVNSSAVSGDATLARNTLGGNATTGDASSMATIISMLQSGWNPASNGELATFNKLISGDVSGDLYIDPSSLPNQVSSNTQNDLRVKAVENGEINNDITLEATSGNAAVTGNTTGGNATSGSAAAMANIVNLISSMISSGKSFLGSVTIDGSFDGDILLPQGMLSDLLASNSSNNLAATINIDSVTNQTTNNTITATAASGQADVSGNTKAGDATTGKAETKVNIINLTGQDIVANNALVVFVNVFGTWTGLIVNAPTGSTAAVLGSGTSSRSVNAASNASLNTVTNQDINNNVTVNANSGNADVTGNTTGGNATTGDAYAGVNIANLTNSSLSLSDWFGILFINVLGNWSGSFGIDTDAGKPPLAMNNQSPRPLTASTDQPNNAPLRFVAASAKQAAKKTTSTLTNIEETPTPPAAPVSEPAVLGAATTDDSYAQKTADANNLRMAIAGGTSLTVIGAISAQLLRRRSNRVIL